ncbi:MAG: NuoM family protein, partial [Opitutales bacterium]
GFAYLMPSLMELPGGGERVVFGLNLGLERVLGIRLAFGLNGISLPLFVLAGLVGFAAGWHALRNAPTDRRNLFLGLLVLMHGGLMGVFGSIDLFFFYFFHELALIPTFLMLGIWGRAGRRTVSMELTVYLTAGAMLSLIGIVALYASADGIAGFNFLALRRYLAAVPVEVALQENFFGLLLLGFGILVSLFPFHSWAPRAYATAPTANAMLHAGVLKKFGVYGLVQIAAVLLPEGLLPWRDWLVWLALGNVVLIGFATVAQTNLRQMIAYSSVMHMGYIFLGLAAFGSAGFGGAVMLMFAHGLSVSAMLLLADYIEDRTGSLDMGRIGGMAAKTPLLAGLFVAATFAGVGLPGFANFWGEFSVFLSLGEDYLWAVAPAGLGIVISAVYALRAVARIFFGQPTTEFRRAFDSGRLFDLAPAERVPAFVLIVALMFVGFWPRSVSDPIDAALPETPAARAELAEESR